MSTLKPRTATVVIYQGDDLERLGELKREAALAERLAQDDLDAARRSARGAPLRGGDPDPLVEAEAAFEAAVKPTRDAYDAFLDEAVERAVEVEVQALGRKRFRALVEVHPPRMVKDSEGKDVPHEDDDGFGVDTATFPDALLTYREGDKADHRGAGVHPRRAVGLPRRGGLRRRLREAVADGLLPEQVAGAGPKSNPLLRDFPELEHDVRVARSAGLSSAAAFYALPVVEQDFHHAEWLRKHSECPQHPGPRDECADPEKDWFPQRIVCHATMERESAKRKYDLLHKTRTWHDGTFPDDPEAWTAERTPDTPFRYDDGVTIYVAPVDERPHDHFLGGAKKCEECSGDSLEELDRGEDDEPEEH